MKYLITDEELGIIANGIVFTDLASIGFNLIVISGVLGVVLMVMPPDDRVLMIIITTTTFITGMIGIICFVGGLLLRENSVKTILKIRARNRFPDDCGEGKR